MHEMAMRGSRPFPLLDAYAYALEYFEVAIVSSNKKKVIAKALQEHGLQDPHAYSCGKKNKRKKFARLLTGIGKPGKVLVVSDTTGDLRFADEQGIPTLGAGWGLHGAEKLRAEKLEHGLGVLDEPQELLPRPARAALRGRVRAAILDAAARLAMAAAQLDKDPPHSGPRLGRIRG